MDNHTGENRITLIEKNHAVLYSVVERMESDLRFVRENINEYIKVLLILQTSFENHDKYSEKAVDLAVGTVNIRLVEMNNFRQTVEDIQSRNINREEYVAAMDGIKKEIVDLQLAKAKLEGMATQKSVTWSIVIGAFGLIFGLFSLVLSVLKIVNY